MDRDTTSGRLHDRLHHLTETARSADVADHDLLLVAATRVGGWRITDLTTDHGEAARLRQRRPPRGDTTAPGARRAPTGRTARPPVTATVSAVPLPDVRDQASARPGDVAVAPLHAPYAADSRAPATWAAYRRDWTQWQAWLDGRGVRPDDATPSHVAAGAADLATTYKASTVCRKMASLGAMYRIAGHASPTRSDVVATTLAGIRRTLGTEPRQAASLTADLLRQILGDLDPTRTADARDGAMLLLGFALAARRSELIALDVTDIASVQGGMHVRIRRGLDAIGHDLQSRRPQPKRPITSTTEH